MHFQWYPGHMTKARRMMQENIKLIDLIIELVDARVPLSSRNPDIDELGKNKARLILLNKSDLASETWNDAWAAWFKSQGFHVVKINSKSGAGLKQINGVVQEACKAKIERDRKRGILNRPVRAMVVGIPNVGKSTFINKVARRKAAAAGDRPGVTRGKQWITVDQGLELLDTPGILWPRFDSQEVGELLAITGAIKAEVLDRETLAANFMLRLAKFYPDAVEQRYKFRPDPACNGFELLEQAAKKRGFLISGGEYDLERMAGVLLDEYRGGKLGRITLEMPEAEA